MRKSISWPATSPNFWYPYIVLCVRTKKAGNGFFFSPMQMEILVQDQELEVLREVFNMAQINMHPWTCTHTSSALLTLLHHLFLQLIHSQMDFFPLSNSFCTFEQRKMEAHGCFLIHQMYLQPIFGALCTSVALESWQGLDTSRLSSSLAASQTNLGCWMG